MTKAYSRGRVDEAIERIDHTLVKVSQKLDAVLDGQAKIAVTLENHSVRLTHVETFDGDIEKLKSSDRRWGILGTLVASTVGALVALFTTKGR